MQIRIAAEELLLFGTLCVLPGHRMIQMGSIKTNICINRGITVLLILIHPFVFSLMSIVELHYSGGFFVNTAANEECRRYQ
jgi:hypothetical protein